METKTPVLVTLDLETMDGWMAFQALGGVVKAVKTISRKVFHRVRKSRGVLKVIYDEREDGIKLITEAYVEMDPMGRPQYTEDQKDFVWKEGKEEEGRAKLKDLNTEMHQVQIVPILWDELVPPVKEGEEDEDAGIEDAGTLFLLADLGFVVDEMPKPEKEEKPKKAEK